MMLPILISASVAPGSYFFCALAVPASAIASSPANAMEAVWFKTRWCIIVLPDVSCRGSDRLMEQLGEPRIMRNQYARLDWCWQQRLGARFSAERNNLRVFGAKGERPQGLSNRARAKRA